MGFAKDLLGGSKGAGFQAVAPSPAQLKTAYNQTQESIKQQQDFVAALQQQNGLANQSSVFQQQQALSDQLQGVADGTGPNPALAALNQATGQNVSNQAALMAGQRGASANTGLIARQAAQQGGNLQQQAVGQGATLQAQQQLGAMGQLQQQQANMGNLAGQQVGQTQAGLNAFNQATLGQQSNLMGLQGNANSANANLAAQNQASQSNLIGNLAGAAGTAAGLYFGGPAGAAAGSQLGSSLGAASKGGAKPTFAQGGPVKAGPRSQLGMMFANGGKVPALVSPGEEYLDPNAVQQVKQGASPMAVGERIPGAPKVSGAKNSYANDTVRKDLDEGGIVLPRSVTQSKNPEKAAADFVSAVFAKNKLKK